ncbi:MAG: BatA domain-containing protein, partial [Planctomycetota bacterium]
MTLQLAQLAGLFTAPALAVAGLVCVAIPVIIHLLSRTRRTRAEWGAMRFLRLAFKKQKRKLRMEKWLLLLTRCAIMVIAGLALSGPLLSGWWDGATPGSASGRTVHVVIEDGLSTRAAVGESSRFAALRTTALELLDGLSPNDRVQLWRGSSASEPHPATPSPTLDHGLVRDTLADLEPGFGRSTLAATLQRVAEAIDAEGDAARQPPVVAVLSDFALGADYLERALPAELATLGERATVVATRPDVGSGNLQIQTLRPRRGLVLTGTTGALGGAAGDGGSGANVSVEAVVRRFDGSTGPASGQLTLFLTRPDGETLPAVTRPVNWSAGQATATLSVDLPIDSPETSSATDTALLNSGGGGMWTVTAALDGEAGVADAVGEDDQRFAVVEVRSRLNVGVITDLAGGLGGSGSGGGLNPAAFVRAALSPEQTGQRFAVATETLPPGAVNAARLDT